MSDRWLLVDGRIVREDEDPIPRDVLVEDGRIARVGRDLDVEGDPEVVDCEGCLILPGLFDMHVHLREPGRTDAETIRTGTEAAIRGGITGLLAMPNTQPAIDTGSMVQFVQDIAERDARIPVLTAGCITRGREGEELAEIGDMHAKGSPMVTDDGNPVADPRVMRRAMEYSRNFDLLVADHPEIPALSEEGSVNEGPVSYRLGVPGRPAVSEEICIERDLRLAELTGARYHVQHLSTAGGLRSVRRFRERGVEVTCEVTPHHLIFSDDALESHDTNLKMNPPLRREEDRARLVEALEAGTIDCLATDHAPHPAFEKRQAFNHAPFGILGLETALPALHTHLIREGEVSWGSVVRAFSVEPRRVLGRRPVALEPDHPAELVVFDPEATVTVDRDFLRSKSVNTPFFGQELHGNVRRVMREGNWLLDGSGTAATATQEDRSGV